MPLATGSRAGAPALHPTPACLPPCLLLPAPGGAHDPAGQADCQRRSGDDWHAGAEQHEHPGARRRGGRLQAAQVHAHGWGGGTGGSGAGLARCNARTAGCACFTCGVWGLWLDGRCLSRGPPPPTHHHHHPFPPPAAEFHTSGMLSVVASLTPYSDFNQSPRNMYQCQMAKQTMGTPAQVGTAAAASAPVARFLCMASGP